MLGVDSLIREFETLAIQLRYQQSFAIGKCGDV